MKTRAITGLFFVIVMLASVLLGPYVFTGFFLILSAFCLYEFYGLVKQAGIKPNIETGILNGIILFAAVAASFYDVPSAKKLLFLPMLTMPAIFIRELFKRSSAPFTDIAYTFLGIIFTIAPFSFFHALGFATGKFDYHLPLGFMLMLWANDTGAYLTGRAFGKHKLFERHSPKKTWEGFIGGVLISAGAGALLSHYFVTSLSLNNWLTIAVIISCIGTMGDLVESMFKRSINVKDSGGILPGHGGLLDRFDGLLMAAPVVYAYVYLIS